MRDLSRVMGIFRSSVKSEQSVMGEEEFEGEKITRRGVELC
jgi:hypothetical protein